MLTYHRHSLPKVLFVLVFFVALFLSLTTPAHADDRSYTINRVQIDATVDEDGTLRVSEKRTYDFDGSFNGVYQRLASLPKGGMIRVEGLSVECLGVRDNLPSIPFQYSWRSNPASAPSGSYSFDEDALTVYVFKKMSSESCDITFNYSVSNAVQFYDDAAELYWQFIGDEWDVPNHDIDVRVTLPVPEGEKASAGENVLIYGHGPLDGEISLSAGVVTAHVPEAGDHYFAEMRVLFPRNWAKPVGSGANVHQENILEKARDEEKGYAYKPLIYERLVSILAGGLSFGALFAAFRVFFRHGREYRPVFKEKYWRDVPDRDVHPAVVTRIWNWGKSSKDIPVTLMHLSNIGAIQLIDLNGEKYAPNNEMAGNFAIARVKNFEGTLTEIDKRVMDFLFNTVALEAWKEKKSVWPWKQKRSEERSRWGQELYTRIDGDFEETDIVFFSDFKYVYKKSLREFIEGRNGVTEGINEQIEKLKPFEAEGVEYKYAFGSVAFLLVFFGIGLGSITAYVNRWTQYGIILVAVVFFVLQFFMRRRTPQANEIMAKSKALKRWLEDFSRIDERPITDVKLWGELMVYAAAFGVADKAIEQLHSVAPSVASNSDFATGAGAWVAFDGSSDSPFDVLSSSMSDTDGSGGGSYDSSDGGGGDFSGGGGGGFGGGGGGAF